MEEGELGLVTTLTLDYPASSTSTALPDSFVAKDAGTKADSGN